jgi:hypothetical protein
MGFINWMLPGWLFATIVGAIVLIAILKGKQDAQIGLTFLFCLV